MKLVVLASLLVLAGLIRLLPLRKNKRSISVDHWYWCMYIQSLRQGERFPPRLPLYVLEKGQWYPPLFPWLLFKMPAVVFEKYSYVLSVSIDLARMIFLFVALKAFHIESIWAYVAAGLAYATTPIVVTYNTQLNPRGLAALFLDGLLVFFILRWAPLSPVLFWSIGCVVGALILLTHKMTTQVWVFISLCLCAVFQSGSLLALIPGSILLAIFLSGGFYLKTLRAHWDIVRFWTEQWPLLGADPLRESPIYGRSDYVAPLRKYEPGFKNFVKRLLSIFVGNYAPAATGALLLLVFLPLPLREVSWMGVWLAATVLFALLTILVPLMRGLGFGNLYLYNAAFPGALIIGYYAATSSPVAWGAVTFLLLLNSAALVRSVLYQRAQTEGRALSQKVVSEIARSGEGTWICFPLSLSEQVAYEAKKPVLWGGHGYGFQRLKEVLPVVRKDFKDFIKDDGLRYVLTDTFNLSEIQRIPIPQAVRFSADDYHIVELLP